MLQAKNGITVDKSEFDSPLSENIETDNTEIEANGLNQLIKCVKDKIKIANRREALQILTLVPNSWTV